MGCFSPFPADSYRYYRGNTTAVVRTYILSDKLPIYNSVFSFFII